MKPAILILTVALLIALSVSVTAQSERIESATRQALEEMPLEGGTAENFTPRFWKIETQAVGDLNKDGLADRVLSFEIDAENGEGQKILKDPAGVFNLLPSPAIVAVLFATTDGKFHRVVVNSRLKPEFEFYTEFAVEIKTGVLLVNEDYSSSNDANHVVFRYRYDLATDKLMLIGFDFEYYTRDKSGTRSENYLTGERVVVVKESERRRSGEFITPGRRPAERSSSPPESLLKRLFLTAKAVIWRCIRFEERKKNQVEAKSN